MSTLNGGPGNIVTNGLVLYLDAANYQSYVSGSTTWRDLSSSNLSGSLINGPTYNSGNAGSIVFDGVDDTVRINSASPLEQVSTTSMAWVYAKSFPNAYNTVICKDEVNNRYNTILVKSNNKMAFYIYCNNSVNIDGTGITTLSINTWYFVAMSYSPTDGLKGYVNGVLDGTAAANGNPVTGSTFIQIGSHHQALSGGASGRYWNGYISNTAVYNRVLTQAEVLQNYNATKGRFGL
jgi:hypothetical protein